MKSITVSRSKSFEQTGFESISGVQKLYFCTAVCGPVPGCKNTIFALLRKLLDLLTVYITAQASEFARCLSDAPVGNQKVL